MKDKYYIHYKTHGIYKVIDECLLEHPSSKEWIDGIVYEEAFYMDPDSPTKYTVVKDPKHFIRSKKRFMESFDEIIIAPFGLATTDEPCITNYKEISKKYEKNI